jgi:hypothetical protein
LSFTLRVEVRVIAQDGKPLHPACAGPQQTTKTVVTGERRPGFTVDPRTGTLATFPSPNSPIPTLVCVHAHIHPRAGQKKYAS